MVPKPVDNRSKTAAETEYETESEPDTESESETESEPDTRSEPGNTKKRNVFGQCS